MGEKITRKREELCCVFEFKEEAKDKMLHLFDEHNDKWEEVTTAQKAYEEERNSENFEKLIALRKEHNDLREKYLKAKSDYAKMREVFYELKEEYDREKVEEEQLFLPTKFIPDEELLEKAGIPKKYATSAVASRRPGPEGIIDIYYGEDETHLHGHNVIDATGKIRFSRMPERKEDGPIRVSVPKITWTM